MRLLVLLAALSALFAPSRLASAAEPPGNQVLIELKSNIPLELLQRLKQLVLDSSTAPTVEQPIPKPRTSFDLLPNWEVGQNAVFVLPKYEVGSAQFVLIEPFISPTTSQLTVAAVESTKVRYMGLYGRPHDSSPVK